MTADIENLVLEHLRPMRAQLDRVETRLDDLRLHVGHIECSVAEHSVRWAELNTRMDRIEASVTRIEKRLDLVES